MPDFLIGLMLVSTAGFLIGLGVHLRRLARGGNIGINQLILNEGRTIRSNGNCGPCRSAGCGEADEEAEGPQDPRSDHGQKPGLLP